MSFEFVMPSRIAFGENCSRKVGEIAKTQGVERVLFLHGKTVGALGLATAAKCSLAENGIEIISYGKIASDPSVEQVEEIFGIAAQEEIGAIVAVGGGSTIDAAKAVNILLGNPEPLLRYEGKNLVPKRGMPLIAIPTTAGTSSEITEVSVLTDNREKRKVVIMGRNVGADYALIDPSLTLDLPAKITAETGMDALTHGIESYLSTLASPLTKYNSLEAIRLLSQNLPLAVSDGKNLSARTNMMLACVIVGFAFANSNLGLVHGIAHVLNARFGLSHGMANAVALPHVMEYNAETSPQELSDIGKAMGCSPSSGFAEGAEMAIEKICSLEKEIGIPSLADLGVPGNALETIASETMKEPVLAFNPREVSEAGVLKVLEGMFMAKMI